MQTEFRYETGQLCVSLFKKLRILPLFWMVLEAAETKVGQDPARMFGYDSAGRKVCGINGFSQSVLRSSVHAVFVPGETV
jgi:hypothetical protein